MYLTRFGETQAVVRKPADREQFSRSEIFDKTRAVVAPLAHIPTVLKEGGMLIVTSGAVPLTVCGGGVPGDPAWDAGCQRKHER